MQRQRLKLNACHTCSERPGAFGSFPFIEACIGVAGFGVVRPHTCRTDITYKDAAVHVIVEESSLFCHRALKTRRKVKE